MNSSEILQKINKDLSINFISVAVTPWQVKGTLANIEFLKSKNITIKGILIVKEHNKTGSCVEDDYLESFDKNNIQVYKTTRLTHDCKMNKFFKLFSVIIANINNNKNDNPIYILNFGYIDYTWLLICRDFTDRKVIFMLGDDGTGGDNGYRGSSSASFLKRIYKDINLKIANFNNAIIDNRLLHQYRNQLIVNKENSEIYRQILRKAIVNNKLLQQFKNKIIINTQCMFDNGDLSGVQDIETFRMLYQCLGKKNTEVLLKPHPRETSLNRYADFNWEICGFNKITQEEIISQLDSKPKAVIGITSSTLVSLYTLFEIRTISLAKLFCQYDLPAGLRKDVDDFIKMYSDLVEMPSNISELQKIIDEL